ncbi:copper chaperone PCu(A)C [Spiribacter halobius]|uniref:Copper chaperone PCu(A)C n=1 Tax=Sediminicurvatus halobius TaxID=2182432 RepID=A0A2U2N0N8_9GAMM|nr:copper chaperone PCu(A)C [Spiribacter halobius]PWG62613.1 copper chaperone PCu(A)C [Spiribacter halobius]UEX78468.1 copper chaperone PCu(A)C [Spiribacter halobius]
MLSRRALPALLLCLLAPLAVADPGPEIRGVWARATPPMIENGAVYFEIVNPAPRADTLLGVETPRVPRAELHRSDTSSGQARMAHTPRVQVPAEGAVRFEPGGRHVMLMGLQEPLQAGERFPLTLRFERAGEVTVEVTVQPATAMGPPEADDTPN